MKVNGNTKYVPLSISIQEGLSLHEWKAQMFVWLSGKALASVWSVWATVERVLVSRDVCILSKNNFGSPCGKRGRTCGVRSGQRTNLVSFEEWGSELCRLCLCQKFSLTIICTVQTGDLHHPCWYKCKQHRCTRSWRTRHATELHTGSITHAAAEQSQQQRVERTEKTTESKSVSSNGNSNFAVSQFVWSC